MPRRRNLKLLRSFIMIMLVLFTAEEAVTAVSETLRVAVSIAPQKYFVERIGGDKVEIIVMTPPGADPHTYEPKPRQLTGLAQVDIYFTVGVAFENAWLERFRSVNPRMKIVATDEGITKLSMTAHGAHSEHGEHGEHSDHDTHHGDNEIPDPHIWLSPPLVKRQAVHVYRALVGQDPANRERYETGYKKFLADIDRLDADLTAMLEPYRGKGAFMVFHPAWGYFADAYGLEQVAVETAGKEPKPADLARLITFAKERGIKAVFVQPQMSDRSAETIAKAIGGELITADPMAENWLANMRRVAESFARALR